jgi:hypothetical protein
MRKPSLGVLLFAVTAALISPAAAHGAVASSFSQSPLEPVAGETVTFTSTASAPGKGNRLIAQQWDLDNDGAFDDASGPTAARSFVPAGTYIVRLRAVDRTLNEAVTAQAVIVHNPPATPLLSPFPVIQVAGRFVGKGTRVRLSVRAPVGSTVSVRCRGRGCALRKQTRTVKAPSAGSLTALLHFRRFQRHVLRARTILKVLITKPGTIGKYSRFEIRRRKPPERTDKCVVFGSTAPIACPAA